MLLAEHLLGEAMLLSFYDRDRNLESPAGVLIDRKVACSNPVAVVVDEKVFEGQKPKSAIDV